MPMNFLENVLEIIALKDKHSLFTNKKFIEKIFKAKSWLLWVTYEDVFIGYADGQLKVFRG